MGGQSRLSSSLSEIHIIADEEFQLSGSRRIQISEFKGKRMVSIREYYQKDGEYLPGKKVCPCRLDVWPSTVPLTSVKGISLPLEQFTAFMAVLPQVVGRLSELGDDVAIPDFSGVSKVIKHGQDEDGSEEGAQGAANGKPSSTSDRSKHAKRNHESTSDEE